ncbi:MAG TPA: DUF3341 domain-containing protein [Anaerolineae bacterium]|nr:DUF3341 domain-containing protein [Anaerolineae bacterium]
MKTPGTGFELVAEFDDPQALLHAARSAREAGYHKVEAYSPYPVEGLAEAVGVNGTWLPLIVLAGGIAGAVGGFGLQYYLAVIAYPLNVGGRPLNSWQAFLPSAFEVAVLTAVLASFVGLLLLTRLPRARYPRSGAIHFAQAQTDRFFLAVEGDDSRFDVEATRQFLAGLGAREVYDVPL